MAKLSWNHLQLSSTRVGDESPSMAIRTFPIAGGSSLDSGGRAVRGSDDGGSGISMRRPLSSSNAESQNLQLTVRLAMSMHVAGISDPQSRQRIVTERDATTIGLSTAVRTRACATVYNRFMRWSFIALALVAVACSDEEGSGVPVPDNPPELSQLSEACQLAVNEENSQNEFCTEFCFACNSATLEGCHLPCMLASRDAVVEELRAARDCWQGSSECNDVAIDTCGEREDLLDFDNVIDVCAADIPPE